MITIASDVRALLESACANVWYFYPQSWAKLPAVSWRESENRELAQADGGEHLAQLEYTVDVWSRSPAENARLAGLIDARMASMRLRRTYGEDLFDQAAGMHQRHLKYRCVADAAGSVYQ